MVSTTLFLGIDMAAYRALLPDFSLSFVFFTALCYAVLGRRFERHRRVAIAVSVVIGLALSTGLVRWEQQVGYSVRDLGPIAVGLALLFLVLVVYQAFRLLGGALGGAGMAVAIVLLIAWLLHVDWPVSDSTVATIAGAAVILGMIALFTHHGDARPVRIRYAIRPAPVHHDAGNLYDDRHVAEKLLRGFRQLRRQMDESRRDPREAENVTLQLRRMLPAEGWLTERMAHLRTTAHRIRQGHLARLEETRKAYEHLPPSAKKKAAAELAAAYNQLIGIDTRLERLDRAVAANEKRIRDLIATAQACQGRHDFPRLYHVIKDAEKLQKHNTKLFQLIDRSEQKLNAIVHAVAHKADEVSDA